MIISRLKQLSRISWYHLIVYRCAVIKAPGSVLSIAKGVKLKGSKILLHDKASLSIGEGTRIIKTRIELTEDSCVKIGANNVISCKSVKTEGELTVGTSNLLVNNCNIWIEGGKMNLGNYNRVCAHIWIRFGGETVIGDYNTINEDTQIRCDERVEVGSCNQISMDIRIWDTNTHRIFYKEKEFESFIISHYPHWNEDEKPKTKPVKIGNNNWIGESVIVKGSTIGNHCIIGTRTMLFNREIGNDMSVMNQLDYRIEKYC